MRWFRLAVPAITCAAWLAVSFAQQGTPAPRTPPAGTPPASGTPPPRPPPAASEDKEEPETAPPAGDDKDDGVDVPTELQPDAAVTFPVDI